MTPPKPTDTWLREKVTDLLTVGRELIVPPSGSFEARSWTLLKLACVRYYVVPYLQILRAKYERLAFIDLFASAGASQYRHGDLTAIVPGSSILAALGAKDAAGNHLKFDEIVSVDRSAENLSSLEQNLARYGFRRSVNFFPVAADTTSVVQAVGQHLSETPNTHALVFADPESLEPAFDALQAMVRTHDAVDLMLLHLVSGAAMANSRRVLRRFYGCDPPARPTRKKLSRLYVSQLAYHLRVGDTTAKPEPTTVVEPVRIEAGPGTGGYSYDLVFAWRQTGGRNPFARIIETLRTKVEKVDGQDVERVIGTMRGPQKLMDNF